MGTTIVKHLVRLSVPLVFAATWMVGPAPQSQAFTLHGCTWAAGTSPIRYGPPARDAGNASTAANNWNLTVVSGKPTIYADPGSVEYGFSLLVYNYGNVSWDGRFNPSTASGGCEKQYSIRSGNVQINTYYLDQYPQTSDIGVIAHEMGHVLGLGHSGSTSCTAKAVMMPYTNTRTGVCGFHTPQSDDVAGLNAKY